MAATERLLRREPLERRCAGSTRVVHADLAVGGLEVNRECSTKAGDLGLQAKGARHAICTRDAGDLKTLSVQHQWRREVLAIQAQRRTTGDASPLEVQFDVECQVFDAHARRITETVRVLHGRIGCGTGVRNSLARAAASAAHRRDAEDQRTEVNA